ncbi:MAG: hypothetical protein INF43_01980 [Alphaproteobacteria bacterium]|jgi:hypothetical protein|nr:hypothetical protein [Alphaproteobacteria bacterium]
MTPLDSTATTLPYLVYHPLLVNAPPTYLNDWQLALVPYVPLISSVYWGLYGGVLVYMATRFVVIPLWRRWRGKD